MLNDNTMYSYRLFILPTYRVMPTYEANFGTEILSNSGSAEICPGMVPKLPFCLISIVNGLIILLSCVSSRCVIKRTRVYSGKMDDDLSQRTVPSSKRGRCAQWSNDEIRFSVKSVAY